MRATALALLFSCGPQVVTKSDCLTFRADTELNQSELDHKVALARQHIAPIVSPEKFCPTFKRTDIQVHDTVSFMLNGREVYGVTNVWALDPDAKVKLTPPDVELGSDLRGLVHELIHVYDLQNGLPGTHLHWAATGRNGADRLYQRDIGVENP